MNDHSQTLRLNETWNLNCRSLHLVTLFGVKSFLKTFIDKEEGFQRKINCFGILSYKGLSIFNKLLKIVFSWRFLAYDKQNFST